MTKGSHIAFFDLNVGDWVTVVGQKAAKAGVAAARASMFDHAKAARPGDDVLLGALRAYRKSPPATFKGDREAGLKHLRGITRASRYQIAGETLARQLGAHGKKNAKAKTAAGGKNRSR